MCVYQLKKPQRKKDDYLPKHHWKDIRYTHNLHRTVIWPLCLHNAPFFCVFVSVSHSECWSSHPHDLRLYGWVGFAQASFYSWHSFLYGTLSRLCVCFMCWHWNSIPSVCVRADLHTADGIEQPSLSLRDSHTLQPFINSFFLYNSYESFCQHVFMLTSVMLLQYLKNWVLFLK